MADPKIITQFRKGIAAGFSKQHIKESLIAKGYNPVEVNLVMQMLEQEQQGKIPQKKPREPQSNMITVIFLLALILIAIVWFGFAQKPKEIVIETPAVSPGELDRMMGILSSLDATQPQKQALLDSTAAILLTNVSREDLIAVVRQNTQKLQELQAADHEQIAQLKFLVGELVG